MNITRMFHVCLDNSNLVNVNENNLTYIMLENINVKINIFTHIF